MKLPSKTVERKLFRDGAKHIIAVDEVGMGCLAGPVVVCAVMFTRNFYARPHRELHWLRDSKLLSAKRRREFAEYLLATPWLECRLAYCSPRTIDRLNIYQAARLAMRRAVQKLLANNYKLKAMVLVDGPRPIAGLGLPQKAIIKGDRKVFAIACASIIAKVFRDRMMERYAKRYPGYGLEQHKGYATQFHQEAILKRGLSPIHRRSFKLGILF